MVGGSGGDWRRFWGDFGGQCGGIDDGVGDGVGGGKAFSEVRERKWRGPVLEGKGTKFWEGFFIWGFARIYSSPCEFLFQVLMFLWVKILGVSGNTYFAATERLNWRREEPGKMLVLWSFLVLWIWEMKGVISFQGKWFGGNWMEETGNTYTYLY